MGVVWRAEDPKLGRDVAVKVLPQALADDPERLARLAQEARSLAALNHTNVASIYGFDEQRYLILEFVPGETLEQRIARGRSASTRRRAWPCKSPRASRPRTTRGSCTAT